MSLRVAQIPYPEAQYIMCAFTLSSDVELNGGKNKISKVELNTVFLTEKAFLQPCVWK